MSRYNELYAAPNKKAIRGGWIDQLMQLRRVVSDGDLISKSDRDELVKLEFTERANGWNIITGKGILMLEQLQLITH